MKFNFESVYSVQIITPLQQNTRTRHDHVNKWGNNTSAQGMTRCRTFFGGIHNGNKLNIRTESDQMTEISLWKQQRR
jgi:hypothetical protein